MGTWIHLLSSVVLADSACITLTHNETTIIDPKEYLGGGILGIEIKSTEEPKVTVLKPENPALFLRIETDDSDWSFGPSVFVRSVQYFTVLSRAKVEVWKANGDSVERVWAATAAVGRVVPLRLWGVTGFAYWTLGDFQLFFLDLTSPVLAARAISGIDTQKISSLVVCSATALLLAIPSSPSHSFTFYEVNYVSLAAVKAYVQASEGAGDTVLDALCTDSFQLLLPTVLLSWSREGDISRFPVPHSFGSHLSLHYAGNESTWYLRTPHAAVVAISGTYLVLQGVRRVISVNRLIESIEEIDSRLTVVEREISQPANIFSVRSVLPHQDLQRIDDLLWLGSPHYQSASLLVKSGRYIEGCAVLQTRPLLIVPSHSARYRFDLCGIVFPQQSLCIPLTVVTVPYRPGDIVRETCGADSPIALSVPITSNKAIVVLFLQNLVSAWNAEALWRFPDLPPGVTCSTIQNSLVIQQNVAVGGTVQRGQFLCAFSSNDETIVLLLRDGCVIESRRQSSAELFQSPLLVLSAVARAHFYAVYAEDGEQGYLLIWRNECLEQYPLRALGLVSMRMTESHVVVLLENCALLATIEGMDWQRIEGQYVGMWAGEGRLALRTTDSLEFYQLRGSIYVPRGRTVLPFPIIQFALSQQELVTLSANRTLSVLRIAGSSGLLLKYSIEVDCPVSYIAAFGSTAVYRCPSHLQILLPQAKKSAVLAQAVATDALPVAVDIRGQMLLEVQEQDGAWATLAVNLAESVQCVQALGIQIAQDFLTPGPIALQGQLTIASAYQTKTFTAVITLENHGAVITPTNRSLSGSEYPSTAMTYRIEPWETCMRISVFDLFQGQSMRLSAESTSDYIEFEIRQTISIQHSVVFPAVFQKVALVPELQTLFAIDGFALITCKYECATQDCAITSRRSVPIKDIGLLAVANLEVIIATGQFIYIRLFGQVQCDQYDTCVSDSVFSYDSGRSDFTVILSQRQYPYQRKFYAVPGNNPNTFHLLFYSTVLEHCTARAQVPMTCAEVEHPALIQIESVGSARVSEQCWHIYAVTYTLQVFALELCENLVLLSASSIQVGALEYITDSLVIGGKLYINTESSSLLYSLPDLTLLSREPQKFPKTNHHITRLWRVASHLTARYFVQQILTDLFVLDVSKPPHSSVVAQLPFASFQFSGESSGYAVVNHTAVIVSFSAAEIALFRTDSALETTAEVTVTAHNDLSTASVRIRVVLAGRWWTLWICAVAAVACAAAAVCRRNHRSQRIRAELEMTKIAE